MDTIKIKRGAGVSLWRQIQERISAAAAAGVVAPGERLPTENDLARRFGVNRHTVRRAMKALEDSGLIRIEQGRGTFVQEHVIDYPVHRRTRFSETLSAQRRQPGGRVLKVETRPATAAMAEALEIDKGAPCVMIRAVRDADGRPVSLADHHFPADRFPDIGPAVRETRSVSKALAQFGVPDYFRQVTRVTARMPDREEARTLSLPINRPLLISESVNVDGGRRPVEYGVTCFAGDRVQLMFEP